MIRAVTRLPLALSVAALVLLVAAALRLPLRPHGDAGEYLLMLESWHRHGSPELQPQDRESLRGLLAREGLAIEEDRVLPELPRRARRAALRLPLLGLLARGGARPAPARGPRPLAPAGAAGHERAPLRVGTRGHGTPALDGLAPARPRGPAASLARPRLPDVAPPRGLHLRPRHAGPRPRGAGRATRPPSSRRRSPRSRTRRSSCWSRSCGPRRRSPPGGRRAWERRSWPPSPPFPDCCPRRSSSGSSASSTSRCGRPKRRRASPPSVRWTSRSTRTSASSRTPRSSSSSASSPPSARCARGG